MKTSNTPPQETIKDVIARGFRSLSQGNLDEARGCCMAVLKQQPKNEQAHFLVGLIGLASNDREKAILAFDAVTDLNPGHVAAWAHLAKCQMQPELPHFQGLCHRSAPVIPCAPGHAGWR